MLNRASPVRHQGRANLANSRRQRHPRLKTLYLHTCRSRITKIHSMAFRFGLERNMIRPSELNYPYFCATAEIGESQAKIIVSDSRFCRLPVLEGLRRSGEAVDRPQGTSRHERPCRMGESGCRGFTLHIGRTMNFGNELTQGVKLQY